jgi:hypothetical protein
MTDPGLRYAFGADRPAKVCQPFASAHVVSSSCVICVLPERDFPHF